MCGGHFAHLTLYVRKHVSDGEVDATDEALLVVYIGQPVAKHLIYLWLQDLTHLKSAELLFPQNGEVACSLGLGSKGCMVGGGAGILSEDVLCVRCSAYLQLEVV